MGSQTDSLTMDELPVSQNHRYTPEQLEQYLAHVKFPSAFPHAIGTLEHLTELIHRQLAYVPFESLALHYSDSHHLLSLDPERLFAKIVTNNRGRGGYCMETNTFFASVLGAMGYEVMHVGGRVSHATGGMGGGGYMGWCHMANIVTLPSTGTRYLVDVGFGSQGPTAPLPLIHGSVTCGIGAQQLRLEYKRVVPHTQRSQRLWVYSHRNGPNEAWTDAYAFSETEFFPQDFELINYGIMTLRNSFFTQAVLCARFVLDNEDGKAADNGGPGISEVVGVRSLIGNTITLKIKERFQDFASAEDAAEYETVMLVWTEDERVEALEKWFNVRLTPQERKGIIGLSSQLRGKKTPMISNT